MPQTRGDEDGRTERAAVPLGWTRAKHKCRGVTVTCDWDATKAECKKRSRRWGGFRLFGMCHDDDDDDADAGLPPSRSLVSTKTGTDCFQLQVHA